MKMMLHPDMIEATRLTREGRLSEATELLQSMLAPGSGQTLAAGGPRPHAENRPLRDPQVIDLTPEMATMPAAQRQAAAASFATEPKDSPAAGAGAGDITSLPMPDALRKLFTHVGRLGRTASGAQARAVAKPQADDGSVLPGGGRFLSATFAGHAGARDYKLYIPGAYRGQPLPLIVMLHGCTQSAEDFAAGTRMNVLAEAGAFFVAYPAQPTSANGSKCWNWFNPGDQLRGHGEPSLIAGMTAMISADYAIDPLRVYVAGLSAGGAAAAIMGATYPDVYAAVGVHSGLACGAASDLPSAFSAMRDGSARAQSRSHRLTGFQGEGRLVPTIVFHGDTDKTVHPRNGDHVIEQSRSANVGDLRPVTRSGQMPGGHAYSRTCHVDADGKAVFEQWVVHGAGHAWSGGSQAGSFADPLGPDASREMVRFFLEHSHPAPRQTGVSPPAEPADHGPASALLP